MRGSTTQRGAAAGRAWFTPSRLLLMLAALAALAAVLFSAGSPARPTASAAPAAPPVPEAPPAPPAARRVELRLERVDRGTGTALVSSGVPLPPGALRAGQQPFVRVLVDGREVAAYVEPLRGTHGDGTLRTVLVQFRASVTGRGADAVLELGERAGVPRLARSTTGRGSPAAVALPASADYLVGTGLVGPTLTVREAAALSPAIRRHDQNFATWADRHWSRDRSNWEKANYYDRAAIYYAAWVRTANPEYWRRGTELALGYRRDYLEANDYGASAHWSQLDGVALHYELTGDEASRTAVGRVADKMAAPYYMNNLQNTRAEMENRMQARVLLSFVLARSIEAPSQEGRRWDPLAREALTKILASQSDDGAYRFRYPGVNQCGHNKPFMVGLLNDALIRYHARVAPDPRIAPAVKRSLDYMWRNDWRGRDRAFVYLDGPCNGEGVGTSADLNNLIVTGYAWYGRESGDRTYLRRADEIFEGAAGGTWLDGSKQFNQQYMAAHNYMAYRAGR